jgi:hypothetical protein
LVREINDTNSSIFLVEYRIEREISRIVKTLITTLHTAQNKVNKNVGCGGGGCCRQRDCDDPTDDNAGEGLPLDACAPVSDETNADNSADCAVRRAHRNADFARQ